MISTIINGFLKLQKYIKHLVFCALIFGVPFCELVPHRGLLCINIWCAKLLVNVVVGAQANYTNFMVFFPSLRSKQTNGRIKWDPIFYCTAFASRTPVTPPGKDPFVD